IITYFDDGQFGIRLQNRCDAFRHQLMVIRYGDSNHGYAAKDTYSRCGICNKTSVPLPGDELISIWPLISSTRSYILINPEPLRVELVSNPTPSSVIANTLQSSPGTNLTNICFAS